MDVECLRRASVVSLAFVLLCGLACDGTSPAVDAEVPPVEPCATEPDATPCDADGVAGRCRAGECVERGCGDGFLDPGERCDDGNQTGGDGCTSCQPSCGAADGALHATVVTGSGRCFASFPETPASFRAASELCIERGGHLPVVRSAEDNNAIAAETTIEGSYLGGDDRATEGSPGWITGAPWSFTAFGTPTLDGELDCIAITPDGVWRGVPCEGARPLVCELGIWPETPTFAVGGGLVADAIASGDFDEDGSRDLVIASTWSGTVDASAYITIVPGSGLGSFGRPRTFTTPTTAACLRVVDVDGDGHEDLLTCEAQVVRVRRGLGDGSFAPAISLGFSPVSQPLMMMSRDLVVADFNADGRNDIAAIATISDPGDLSRLRVFLQQANGAFSPQTEITISNGDVSQLAVEDFNRDGKPDLLISQNRSLAHHVAGISQLAGTGTGGFTSARFIPLDVNFDANLIVDDFDGDGRRDLAFAARTPATPLTSFAFANFVMRQQEDGSFATPAIYPNRNLSLTLKARDLDGDQRLDLVTPQYHSGSVCVRRGLASGGFADEECFVAGQGLYDVAIDDFNGDGRLDVVAAGGSPAAIAPGVRVTLLTGRPSGAPTMLAGSLSATVAVAGGVWGGASHAADLDGDGRVDLIQASRTITGEVVHLHYGRDQSGFARPIAVSVAEDVAIAPMLLGTLDVTTAGARAIVVVSAGQKLLRVFSDLGAGYAEAATHPVASTPRLIATGDFNGDGRADVALAGVGPDAIEIWHDDGTGILVGSFSTISLAREPTALASADLNNDGRDDLLVGGQQGLTTFLSEGGAVSTDLAAIGGGVVRIAAARLDQDDFVDLVVVHHQRISILMGRGDGTFAISPEYYAHGVVGLADLNSDGRVDLVRSARHPNRLTVELGVGDGTFGAVAAETMVGCPVDWTLAFGDIDGNGRLDVLAPCSEDRAAVSVLFGPR